MKVIGLTGGIASGKSTIANLLRSLGAPVFDADAESRALVAKGRAALNEIALTFGDIRTFGTLYLVTNNDAYIEGYETLGPEPLSEGFTAGYMRPVIAKSRKPIKTLILEQTFIAGLGNIYADESLALSGILPMRTANTLTDEEIDRLHDAINKVIAQGIANRGTTFRDYKDGEGNKGDNQNHLLVYGRKGLCCKMCGGELLGTKVGGRGTTYCPHCQK